KLRSLKQSSVRRETDLTRQVRDRRQSEPMPAYAHAMPDEQARIGPSGGLGYQSCLAGPGVADDHHDAGYAPPRPIDGLPDGLDLDASAYEPVPRGHAHRSQFNGTGN